jgi:excisionase family DNA binding protein
MQRFDIIMQSCLQGCAGLPYATTMNALPPPTDEPTATCGDQAAAKLKAPRQPTQKERRARPEHTTIEPLALRIPGVAKALNLGLTATKALVLSGKIRSVKVGTTRLIPIAEIKRFLDGK